jgi:hypothetical protein
VAAGELGLPLGVGAIDWSEVATVAATGIVVGMCAFGIAIGVAYLLRNGPIPTGLGSGLVRRGLRRYRAASGTAEIAPWLCERCRSVNDAAAGSCYRGCGPRDAVRMLLPGDVRPAAAEIVPEASLEAAADQGEPDPGPPPP